MSPYAEPQPDAWQQNAVFTELLQAPAAKQALASLETHLKPIFNSHALYSLETGQLIVKLHSLTSLLNRANLLPHLTPHDFKLGLHLAITPSLSQSASPCKDQPLHFEAFLNAVAFCAFYYPPLRDVEQTPKPRLFDGSMSNIEDLLENARERLVAAIDSPRSIVAKASPGSSVAFATPYATLPMHSPSDPVSSGVSASPRSEMWFTPAPPAIRTRLFQLDDVDTAGVSESDAETENHLAHIGSVRKFKPEVCSETLEEDDIKRSDMLYNSESPKQTSTDTSGNSTSETPHMQPEIKLRSCQDPEAITSPAQKPNIRETNSPRELAVGSEPEESIAQQTFGEEPEAASPASSSSIGAPVVSTPQVQLPDTLTDKQWSPAQVNDSGSPECPSTDSSLAPSTALSHLPSPASHFESPHLSSDAKVLQAALSSEPKSSRKISFSDSESDSDYSSYYGNECDDQDTMTRIDNAFDNSCPVDEGDEELCSDMVSPYSPCPYIRGSEDTIVIRTSGDEDEQLYSSEQLSSTAPPESEAEETESRTPVHNLGVPLSLESEHVAVDDVLDAEDVNDISKADEIGENNFTCVFNGTQDVVLNEPQITLGLPADAFSEAAGGILRTPLSQEHRTRLCDTDMDYEDEEDHTLLFDDGNESDGSELSMGTRETMRKLVEDHLSFHGTASSQRYECGHFYAEDQVLVTPDRKSHMRFTTTYNAIVEDGPFASEKAETRRSTMTRIETDQVVNSAEACDRDMRGFTFTMDAAAQDVDRGILSPVIGSRRGSYSSEISPDGLNLIKKQLVLPHPFVPAGSTVGSSISSGPGTQDEKDLQRNENVKNQENQRIVAVSPKKIQTVTEKGVAFSQQEMRVSTREVEVEMVHVMRETLETCRMLREEMARKRQPSIEYPQQQRYRGWGRFMEFGLFGLVIVIVTLVLVERRIQRDMFLDVLV